MSNTAQPFDINELMCVLDATEATGAPPEMVEQLRGLVRAAGWGWDDSADFIPSLVIQAGDSFGAGDRVIFEQDGRIYLSDYPHEAGVAIRDIREGEFVRYRKTGYQNGFSYEPHPYEFG